LSHWFTSVAESLPALRALVGAEEDVWVALAAAL